MKIHGQLFRWATIQEYLIFGTRELPLVEWVDLEEVKQTKHYHNKKY